MSLIQQYLLGSRSWNYANEPLNIGGRTTAVVTLPAIFLYGQRANGVVFDNWFAQHIGRLSMTTSCACISRTCACESHRGSSGTIYRPPARSAVMAYGRHARLAPS